MKKLLLLLSFACLPVFAEQGNGCFNSVSNYVDFTGTTAVLATSVGGQRIHVCQIDISLATAQDYTLTSIGSGTVLTGALATATYTNNAVDATIKPKAGENLGITIGASVHARIRVAFYQQ